MIRTKDISMDRGQTKTLVLVVKDSKGARIDLTGAQAYLWVRADLKVDGAIKLSSTALALHRIGIVIDADQVANKGRFTVTLIPSDTTALVALGADDPYLYDVWIVDATGAKYPVISTSKLALFPQITTVP